MAARSPSTKGVSAEERQRRRLLFKPCNTEEELKDWLWSYLGIDLPDCIVDPDSNASPFGLVWEIYRLALDGGSEDVPGYIAYAARDSFKTFLSGILEVLMLFHCERDVVHMAAIEAQSKKAQEYVRSFLERPYLRDYKVGDNQRELEIIRYENRSDPQDNLTEPEFMRLSIAERDGFERVAVKIVVTVCTTQGVQGQHAPFVVTDEVDVVQNKSAYTDSKLIPGERKRRGKRQLPITLLISTRKSGIGLVQREIDEALHPKEDEESSGLKVVHWNRLDVTERCPPERHRPDLPKIRLFVHEERLQCVTAERFQALQEAQKAGFREHEGFAGCVTNCRIFAACRGHLALRQQSVASTLKSVADAQQAVRRVKTPDAVNAQILSRKPSSEGLVYPRLLPADHYLSHEQVCERFEMKVPPGDVRALIAALRDEKGGLVAAGVDFGFTHNFAVTMGVIVGPWCLVFDAVEVSELEEAQQIALCKERFAPYGWGAVWADPAYPGATKAFRRAGFPMRTWAKKAGSVKDGIQIVRSKLRPVFGDPELFFLAGVPAVDTLFERLEKYHWCQDASGRYTDVPDEDGDDGPDSARYLVMNAFPTKNSGLTMPRETVRPQEIVEPHPPAPSPIDSLEERQRRWNAQIMEHVGLAPQSNVVGRRRLKLVT